MVSTLVLYVTKQFNFGPTRLGELMSAFGVCTVFAEGILVRVVVPAIGEVRTMQARARAAERSSRSGGLSGGDPPKPPGTRVERAREQAIIRARTLLFFPAPSQSERITGDNASAHAPVLQQRPVRVPSSLAERAR